LIERMRRDGLLLRMRSRVDRRCSVLLLTELGVQRLGSITAGRDHHLSHWLDRLTTEEQTLLCHLLDRLLDVLEQASPPESPAQSQPTEWGQAA
jgi:DNA-binding MarR family transcriptional regulator